MTCSDNRSAFQCGSSFYCEAYTDADHFKFNNGAFLFILSDKTEKIKMKITRHYKSLLSAIISVALFYSAAAHADILDLHARKLWQHDYVRLPELVEDVCNAYKKIWAGSYRTLS